MKFNKYFMLGLAGLAFAACSNDEDVVSNSNEEGKMYVSLSMGSAKTRSLGNGAVGQYNTITDLKILFYDAAERYVPYEIKEDIRTAAINDLKTKQSHTLVLTDVPATAEKLYIIANEKSNNQIAVGTLDQARATTIYLANQVKTTEFENFSNEESTLTGLGDIEDGANNIATATIELVPVTARIEVQNFVAVEAPESYKGDDIESFTIEGIYINKFYYYGSLGGTLADNRTRIDNGQGTIGEEKGAAYSKVNYSNYVIDSQKPGEKTNFGFLCDEPIYIGTTPDTESIVAEENETVKFYELKEGQVTTTDRKVLHKVRPIMPEGATSRKWWGYSIFRGATPDMVIKLKVKYKNQSAEDGLVRFLTVTSYHTTTLAGGAIDNTLQTMERGYVYRMTNFVFDATNLTDKPYEISKTVNATVTVAEWEPIDVYPGFN